eukprot:gene3700-4262_t
MAVDTKESMGYVDGMLCRPLFWHIYSIAINLLVEKARTRKKSFYPWSEKYVRKGVMERCYISYLLESDNVISRQQYPITVLPDWAHDSLRNNRLPIEEIMELKRVSNNFKTHSKYSHIFMIGKPSKVQGPRQRWNPIIVSNGAVAVALARFVMNDHGPEPPCKARVERWGVSGVSASASRVARAREGVKDFSIATKSLAPVEPWNVLAKDPLAGLRKAARTTANERSKAPEGVERQGKMPPHPRVWGQHIPRTPVVDGQRAKVEEMDFIAKLREHVAELLETSKALVT